jgi:hypothetical protein
MLHETYAFGYGCFSYLRCQSLERQRVGSNHMTQSVNEQIGSLPAVKTELHFVQVGLQVFGANLVPGSHNAALQQRERTFHCISVYVSPKPDVFFSGVVDLLMWSRHVGLYRRFARAGYVVHAHHRSYHLR